MIKTRPRTFENDDLLDLKKFCDRLENFLLIEQDFVEGSLVIGLNGGFGSGKSTFIEMWASSLLERREEGKFVPMPVILNAWESDHCGDPLLAILAGLMETIEKWEGADCPDNKTSLRQSAKEAAWFLAGIGNGILANASGVNVVEAREFAQKKTGSDSKNIPDIIDLFLKRVGALAKLKQQLTSSLGGVETKVIFFVDELDRCRPDYAVSYLEVIKHVFDVSGLAFVLAIDYPHLSNSAKSLFGAELNFEDYFRKFCHRTFNLPDPSEESQARLSKNYIKHYLIRADKRSSMIDISDDFEKRVVALLKVFPMKPRQIQEAFRILGFLLQTVEQPKIGKIKWAIGSGALLMSFLKVFDSKLFVRISLSHEGVIEICQHLKNKMLDYDSKWWIRLVLSGAWESRKDDAWIEQTLVKLELRDADDTSREEFIARFSDGWGNYHRSWINRLTTLIDSADKL